MHNQSSVRQYSTSEADGPTRGLGVVGDIATDLAARFTGEARPGQQPALRLTGPQWWLVTLVVLVGSVGANIILLKALPSSGAAFPVYLVAYFWLAVLTTGALRNCQVTFAHHAVHGALFSSAVLNRFAACAATVIPFAQNETEYRADHVGGHHRRKTFTTVTDPDAAYLIALGFRPGMKCGEAWRLFLLTLVSPAFHFSFLAARLRSTFLTASPRHRVAAIAWTLMLGALATQLPFWVFACAVLVPLGPLYAMSSLLQFASEHAWLVTAEGPGRDNLAYARGCQARFCVGRPPKSDLALGWRCLAWARWTLALIFVHAPVRFGVLVGDLTCHDFHHLAAFVGADARDWRNAPFERRAAVDRGEPLVLAAGVAFGIVEALDWVFLRLERSEFRLQPQA